MNFIYTFYPALQHVGFRLYFTASLIGMLGLWVNITGQQWLVYTLTDSPLKLGLLGAAQFLPTLFLSLHAGVIIDRVNKKSLVLVTQTLLMCTALILAYLVWSGIVQYWHVLALGFIAGLVSTFDIPARQALLPELVDSESLRNGVNLISITINLARFLGPAIGAYLIHHYGIAVCFLFNGLAFLPVILMINLLHPTIMEAKSVAPLNITQEIREGVTYARSKIYLRYPLAFVAIVSMVLWNYVVTMPIFAGTILRGNVTDFGLLMASLGGGSFLGAFIASTFFRSLVKIRELLFFVVAFHVFYFLTAFASHVIPACIGFTVMGIFGILFLNGANAMLQMNAGNEFRGRVMSLFSLVFFGVAPLGNVTVGWFLGVVDPAVGIRILPCISIVLIAIAAYALRDKEVKNPA